MLLLLLLVFVWVRFWFFFHVGCVYVQRGKPGADDHHAELSVIDFGDEDSIVAAAASEPSESRISLSDSISDSDDSDAKQDCDHVRESRAVHALPSEQNSSSGYLPGFESHDNDDDDTTPRRLTDDT